MIVTINGKPLAFGMRWQILVRAEAPGREARAAKSSLMWVDTTREYFGILAREEVVPKGVDRVYSAAQALLNTPQSSSNMLLVLHDPVGHGYLVCGVMQKRPRNGFDVEGVDDAALGELLARFTDLCGDDGFDLLGDAPLDGITAMTLDDLAEAADEHCVLRSAGSALRFAPHLALVAAIAVGLLAWHHYHQRQKQLEARQRQKTPAQMYREAVAARANSPTFPSSQIGQWSSWAQALPPDVGGWKLQDVTCNLSAEQRQFSCTLSYKRGESPLATNRTFADRAPKEWQSIEFDDDAQTAHVAIAVKVTLGPTSAALQAAPTPKTVELDFGSTLQTLSDVTKRRALGRQYDIFALPPGMVPSSVLAPIMVTSWTLVGPFRIFDAVQDFPKYTTIDHIALEVKPTSQRGPSSSIAMVTVSGNVYAKQ